MHTDDNGTPSHRPSHLRRSAAAAALALGVLGALTPGGYQAHAASPRLPMDGACTTGTLQPSKVTTASDTVSATATDGTSVNGFFGGGPFSLTVDNSAVTFNGNGVQAISYTQSGDYGKVQAGGCLSIYGPADAAALGASGSLTFQGGEYKYFGAQFVVNPDGTDDLTVNLQCGPVVSTTCGSGPGGITFSAGVGSLVDVGGNVASTPELSPTELVATGFVVAPLLYLVRRRRQKQQR